MRLACARNSEHMHRDLQSKSNHDLVARGLVFGSELAKQLVLAQCCMTARTAHRAIGDISQAELCARVNNTVIQIALAQRIEFVLNAFDADNLYCFIYLCGIDIREPNMNNFAFFFKPR